MLAALVVLLRTNTGELPRLRSRRGLEALRHQTSCGLLDFHALTSRVRRARRWVERPRAPCSQSGPMRRRERARVRCENARLDLKLRLKLSRWPQHAHRPIA